ncbi:MAG: cinnamycin family lantibiotic [Actinomycetota bacterium]
MSAILSEMPIDLDELFYQSVVDEEFRAQLLADPTVFGLDDALTFALPAPVESQDPTLLELASRVDFIVGCASTCSFGPYTVVCDGTTK